VLAQVKARTGERASDVLKLLETADSCAREPYGTHERNPMITGFNSLVLASESLLKLGRYREALTVADRALELRPTDTRAREAWEQAVGKSREQLPSQPDPEIQPTVTPAVAAARLLGEHTPVFVVSSGRCGSTLVSNMLNLNRDILSLSEFVILLMPGAFAGAGSPIYGSQFWSLLSAPRKRMNLMYRHGIAFDELLYKPGPGKRFTLESGVPPIMITALPHLTDDPESLYDEIEEFVLAQGPYPIGQHFRRLFDWMCKRLNRKLWVERSGSSMIHLSDLLMHFPDARFVHLFRDGRECAISMSNHSAFRLAAITGELQQHIGIDPWNTDEPVRGELPDDLKKFLPESFDMQAFWEKSIPVEGFGTSWTAQERRGIELLAQLPSERVLLLRYENLVSNPRGELTRMMKFISAPFDDDYLDRAASIVRAKPPSWPQLPADVRDRLDKACRTGMGLLYGSEEVFEPVPAQ